MKKTQALINRTHRIVLFGAAIFMVLCAITASPITAPDAQRTAVIETSAAGIEPTGWIQTPTPAAIEAPAPTVTGWSIQFEPFYDIAALFDGINPITAIVGGLMVIAALIVIVSGIIGNNRKGGDE